MIHIFFKPTTNGRKKIILPPQKRISNEKKNFIFEIPRKEPKENVMNFKNIFQES